MAVKEVYFKQKINNKKYSIDLWLIWDSQSLVKKALIIKHQAKKIQIIVITRLIKWQVLFKIKMKKTIILDKLSININKEMLL